MDNRIRQILIAGTLIAAAGAALLLLHFRPYYFNNEIYLAGLIFLQLLLFAVCKFRAMFFAFLMTAFIWAGLDAPMAEAWTSARWLVLATGAALGFLIFLHDKTRHFHAFHLIALFSVGAAFVSALVSTYPKTAVLKAASLFLLFLYAGAGGRLAICGREQKFLDRVLLACEAITYLTVLAYFPLHLETWGNPNSLGLVMGIGVVPLLFWGILIPGSQLLQWRRSAALLIALFLLLYSASRASMIASIGSMVIVATILRRQKLLVVGTLIALFALAATTIMAPEKLGNLTESTSDMIYKGHRDIGILGSRRSPWQQTTAVIAEHPWFGSGFGTSPSGQEQNREGMYASNTDNNREHGSSYLAILEWVGLLGGVPFAAMLSLLIWKIRQALAWMLRTRRVDHPMVPVILVLLGGLIHAAFEDWLFAVGYYFTVFFWVLAFSLFDLVPNVVSIQFRRPEYAVADILEQPALAPELR